MSEFVLNVSSFKSLYLSQQGCYFLSAFIPTSSNLSAKNVSFRPTQPRLATSTDQSGLLATSLSSLSSFHPSAQKLIQETTSVPVEELLLFNTKCVELHCKGVTEGILNSLTGKIENDSEIIIQFFLFFIPLISDQARDANYSSFSLVNSTTVKIPKSQRNSFDRFHFHFPLVFTSIEHFCSFSCTFHYFNGDSNSNILHQNLVDNITLEYKTDVNFALKAVPKSTNIWRKFLILLSSCSAAIESYLKKHYFFIRKFGFSSFIPNYILNDDCCFVEDYCTSQKIHEKSFEAIKNESIFPLNYELFPWNSNDFTKIQSISTVFRSDSDLQSNKTCHKVFFLHGLYGKSSDFFYWRSLISLFFPQLELINLSSITDFSQTLPTLIQILLSEISHHLSNIHNNNLKISFLSHSLGGVIIRGLISHPEFRQFRNNLHLYLSLATPHLGIGSNSTLVKSGFLLIKTIGRQRSLSDISIKSRNFNCCSSNILHDVEGENSINSDCFLSSLAISDPSTVGLGHFKYVMVFGSKQDGYVPVNSSLIMKKRSKNQSDDVINHLAQKLSSQISGPIISKFSRFHVEFSESALSRASGSKFDSMTGRNAHIAFLVDIPFIINVLHMLQNLIDE
ncbi:hypothetical protein RCL1_006471 [Eukaryota sp. TZLM3-RCL]